MVTDVVEYKCYLAAPGDDSNLQLPPEQPVWQPLQLPSLYKACSPCTFPLANWARLLIRADYQDFGFSDFDQRDRMGEG